MGMEVAFGTFLIVASVASGQLWNDPANAITVKTLYVPIRKGSNSIPIPDFSRVRPLATLNLPTYSAGGGGGGGGGDFQLASTVNHNYRPKMNPFESHVNALQDVRPKVNNQVFKPDMQNQNTNFHSLNQGNNFHQQMYNNPHQQQMVNSVNHHSQGQHHFHQLEPVSNFANGHHQNVLQRNNTVIQHQNGGLSSGNMAMHEAHSNSAGNKISNFHNSMNYPQQIYTNDNIMIQRIPNSNLAYSQFHNSQNPMQQAFQRGHSANHEGASTTQNSDTSHSGDSSRHFQQVPTDSNPSHQLYMTTPNENPSFMAGHHQANYGIQNEQNNQHMENMIRNNNAHQGFHNQDNRYVVSSGNNQLQQPVNTYAIVHQRVPNNNFVLQNNKASPQSEHTYHRQAFETRPPNSHASYLSTEPTTSNQEQIPFQVPPQNQMRVQNLQNSLENQQYQVKQMGPVSMDNQQYNGHQVAHVQLMMSQLSQNQQESPEAQYATQQQSSSVNTEVQNQDDKTSHSQNSMTSTSYPDPASETYYPENKQVYASPPTDYSSHGHHQQLPSRDQTFVRYPSHIETNGQNNQLPITIQTGQVGVHVTLPNRNFGYQEQSKYNNGYA